MQKYYQMPLALAGLSLITACGGASTGGADVTMDANFAEIVAQFEDVEALFDGNALTSATPGANLPTGTVSYDGVAYVIRERRVYDSGGFDTSTVTFGAIGDATTTIDFTGDAVNIAASGFYEVSNDFWNSPDAILDEQTGTPIAGQVTFSTTRDDTAPEVFLGTAIGSVTTTSGETLSVNLPGGGAFFGQNAEYLSAAAFDENLQPPTETNPEVDDLYAAAFLFKQ